MTYLSNIRAFVLPSPVSELPFAPLSVFALMNISNDQNFLIFEDSCHIKPSTSFLIYLERTYQGFACSKYSAERTLRFEQVISSWHI
jgi:hypothetical protein